MGCRALGSHQARVQMAARRAVSAWSPGRGDTTFSVRNSSPGPRRGGGGLELRILGCGDRVWRGQQGLLQDRG